MIIHEIKHGHLFCGLGGGAKGFNMAQPRVGNMVGKFRCLGGIDVDPAAIRDFERLSGVSGTVLDLFDRSQYLAFHGKEPPAEWREAGPADIVRAMGNERPDIWFLSAPCKGFSGLLSEGKSKTDKYQALNRLTLRGIWLALEAYKDDPADMIVFENVPRIAHRGRHLLDQIVDLLRHYGYAVAETTHDCGELGGLAQSRKRFLLVARHVEKVPPFLYEPEKKRLQAVGTVLDRMPLPGDLRGGPMHRVPNLQWKTWVRLAFVEAGSDWRSLNKLTVEDGYLRDFLITPDLHNTVLGVRNWGEPTGAVVGRSLPLNGAFSIADPRFPAGGEYGQLGVRGWEDSTGTVTGQRSPIQGGFSVADPRTGVHHNNCFRVVRMDQSAGTVTSGHGPSSGGQCVADPRPSYQGDYKQVKYRVTGFDESTGSVISASTTGNGAFAVADPRPGINRGKGDNYLTAGHYGVVRYDSPSGAVSAAAGHDNGRWSVADPRLPAADEKLVAIIRSLDGTWHRPFTTLELAALQSLVDPEEIWSPDPKLQQQIEAFDAMNFAAAAGVFRLAGESDSEWRERIGNAVPPAAAQAIAEVMGVTLLLARSGETFMLSATPIWVRPVAIALSLAQGGVV
jgi:site-specific DNA-cytosine methylase